MGAPPAFNPSQQQSSSKLWLWLLLIVVGFCVLCVVGLFFAGKAMMQGSMGFASCMMNGDLARQAVVAYAMEHEGTFPAAETWQDDVRPNYERLYNKMMGETSEEDMPEWMNFRIAAPGEILECEVGGGKKTGFAYNVALSGKKMTDFPDAAQTIVIYEMLSPALNAFGSPDDRGSAEKELKLFGQERTWLDFHIQGDPDPFESGNAEFNVDIDPKDGLPPDKGTTNQSGS